MMFMTVGSATQADRIYGPHAFQDPHRQNRLPHATFNNHVCQMSVSAGFLFGTTSAQSMERHSLAAFQRGPGYRRECRRVDFACFNRSENRRSLAIFDRKESHVVQQFACGVDRKGAACRIDATAH